MRLAITGGASGIGAETISLLQSAGHELVVFDLHEPTADVNYVPLDLMNGDDIGTCLLYTSPSPRDYAASRMPSSA